MDIEFELRNLLENPCQHIPSRDMEVCEHGMSAWLCMGSNHYPSRDDEMNGRYY